MTDGQSGHRCLLSAGSRNLKRRSALLLRFADLESRRVMTLKTSPLQLFRCQPRQLQSSSSNLKNARRLQNTRLLQFVIGVFSGIVDTFVEFRGVEGTSCPDVHLLSMLEQCKRDLTEMRFRRIAPQRSSWFARRVGRILRLRQPRRGMLLCFYAPGTRSYFLFVGHASSERDSISGVVCGIHNAFTLSR